MKTLFHVKVLVAEPDLAGILSEPRASLPDQLPLRVLTHADLLSVISFTEFNPFYDRVALDQSLGAENIDHRENCERTV